MSSGLPRAANVLIVLALALPMRSQPVLQPLSDVEFWKFDRYLGSGGMRVDKTPMGDVLGIESDSPDGMAASVHSPKLAVEPGRQYVVTMEIKTEGFVPVNAKLTGAPYMFFWDARLLPGGYQPMPGTVAPSDSDWHMVSQVFTTPETARTAELHLAYAAYGIYEQQYYPRVTGRARGRLWIRSVRIDAGRKLTPPPVTIHVPDPVVQQALVTAANCLHDSSLSGQFTVSDGYTISGNIVPDLSFGLFGVRRLANPEYIDILKAQWAKVGDGFTPEGRAPQRVMSQVLFPLGVDEIYSFTGDRTFLEKYLPVADRSFDFMSQRANSNGLVRLVDYGQWHIGQGADWVDWYPTRMEGKTFNFHQWYVRALRRSAALHRELSRTAGDSDDGRAKQYLIRADQIEKSLRRLYWYEDHFVTNVDYGGRIADEKWLDDQLWAIQLGVATPEMTSKIWSWIDADPFKYEGVPTRWAAFEGPEHGPLDWFGRLGAGDILARYRSGNPRRGMQLLKRISEIFARDGNVYEAYDMYGDIVPGTLGWGNYTEHSGGYLWAVVGGPFGISFDSDAAAVATVSPQFPDNWPSADATVYLRGSRVKVTYERRDGKSILSLEGDGAAQPVRVILPGGEVRLVHVGAGGRQTFEFH